MSSVKVTLAAGVALTIVAIALTLTRSPPRVVRVNDSGPLGTLGDTQEELAICQEGETLPADVSAIRVSIVAFFGSNMQVAAYRGGRILTEGSRNPDWSGSTVTVPVKPLSHATSHVNLCVAFEPNSQLLQLFGSQAGPRTTAVAYKNKVKLGAGGPRGQAVPLNGRLRIAFLAAGRGSWSSRVSAVARDMGLGHFIGGNWVALLAAALMAAVAALALRVTLREQP